MTMTRTRFGNRRAGILCNLAHSSRLNVIAECLPIIADSAFSFWTAAEALPKSSLEAVVLAGFAGEEAAKALILMDLVRCPP